MITYNQLFGQKTTQCFIKQLYIMNINLHLNKKFENFCEKMLYKCKLDLHFIKKHIKECLSFLKNNYDNFNNEKKIFQNIIIFILIIILLKNSKELFNAANNAIALAITTTVYFAGCAFKAFPFLTAQSYVNVLISFNEFLGPFPINQAYQNNVNWITGVGSEILKIRTQGFFSEQIRFVSEFNFKNVYLYNFQTKSFWFLEKPTTNIGLYGQTTLSSNVYGETLFRLGKKTVAIINYDNSPYLKAVLNTIHDPLYKSHYNTCSAVVLPDFEANSRANARGKLILLSVGVFLANATVMALKG